MYQHAAEDRDVVIAEAMSKLAIQPLPQPSTTDVAAALRVVSDGQA
jgi:hypothetical protein